MEDLLGIMVNLPDTKEDHLDTVVDIPDTMVDLPGTMILDSWFFLILSIFFLVLLLEMIGYGGEFDYHDQPSSIKSKIVQPRSNQG